MIIKKKKAGKRSLSSKISLQGFKFFTNEQRKKEQRYT